MSLSNLTDEELADLRKSTKNKISRYTNLQLAKKVCL